MNELAETGVSGIIVPDTYELEKGKGLLPRAIDGSRVLKPRGRLLDIDCPEGRRQTARVSDLVPRHDRRSSV